MRRLDTKVNEWNLSFRHHWKGEVKIFGLNRNCFCCRPGNKSDMFGKRNVFPRTVRVWRDKGSLFLRGTFSWSSFSVPVVVLFLKSLGWNTAPVLGRPQWAACPTFCLGADPLAASKTLQLIFHLVSLAKARWCLLAAKRVNTLFFGPTLRNNCILFEEISLAI